MSDKLEKLVQIQSFEGDGKLTLVNGYDTGGFTLNHNKLEGPVALFPRDYAPWTPANPAEPTVDEWLAMLGDYKPPLILFGTGGAPTSPYPKLRATLSQAGFALEVLSTASACRTWNVLISEKRDVAGFFLPVGG